MKRVYQLMAALLLCHLIACNSSADSPNVSMKDIASVKKKYKSEELNKVADGLVSADTVSVGQNQFQPPASATTTAAKQDWDKKIIKTGNLALEVKNYKAFNELLHAGIKQYGGYIAQEEQSQSEDKIENTVTIKVPVDQFDNAVNGLTPSAEKIVEKKITAEDVTGELVDTKSRMEAKKRVRDRYLDLLKQAKNMEEILQVQNEVNDIQETIEAAAGRVDYLGHAAAFSTINIHFYQVVTAPVHNTDPSYGLRLLESFKAGLHWFSELFVVLVSLWPLWTVIAVAWIFIRKKSTLVKNQRTVS